MVEMAGIPRENITPETEEPEFLAEDKILRESEELRREEEERNKKRKGLDGVIEAGNSFYDLTSSFERKEYNPEDIYKYWLYVKSIDNTVAEVKLSKDGKGCDVDFTSGTKLEDRGDNMLLGGKNGATPVDTDFDKAVRAGLDRGWRAIVIGPNSSDEFKRRLYLACARAGVECVTNGYNPPEETKEQAKALYAAALKNKEEAGVETGVVNTKEDEEKSKVPENKENETKKETPELEDIEKTKDDGEPKKNKKGDGLTEKEKKEKKEKDELDEMEANSDENISKVGKIAKEFKRGNSKKLSVEIEQISNEQFMKWQKDFVDLQSALSLDPSKKLSSRQKKLLKNAGKYKYDKHNKPPKGLKINPKDFDKQFYLKYSEKKQNNALNEVSIKYTATMVEGFYQNSGKTIVGKDDFKATLDQNVERAKKSVSGDKPKDIMKAIQNVKNWLSDLKEGITDHNKNPKRVQFTSQVVSSLKNKEK